jgi:alcohol dehydrogenase (cytochrome c)
VLGVLLLRPGIGHADDVQAAGERHSQTPHHDPHHDPHHGGPSEDAADWPSYNRTDTAERYAELAEINARNVQKLKVLCTFDIGGMVNFQSGLIKVGGLLYGTTETDTFAIDPSSCKQAWRVHEEVQSTASIKVNRGVAYEEGRLFRGTPDGRVLAYDARNGKRLWEARIADDKKDETVPAAPVVWNGLVLVGNAGGDIKGVKGRMYALDARDGKIVWERFLVPTDPQDAKAKGWNNSPEVPVTGGATWTTYTLDSQRGLLYVPSGNPAPDFDRSLRAGSNLYTSAVVVLDAKTGAIRTHFPITPADFHDYDVAAAPALFTTKSGKHLLAVAPKDGHLRGFDLSNGRKLYETPVTRIENRDTPLGAQPVHFCPGPGGGVEWNGPAYDPDHNLIFTGAVEWCTTVVLGPAEETRRVPFFKPWVGTPVNKPEELFGKIDPQSTWAGWIYATDADSGRVAWKFKAPHPILSGITPTAGDLVFVGDLGGTLYAFDSASGRTLWSKKIGGALGGGVITYLDNKAQRIAVATGMTSKQWPVEQTTAKVVVLGL